MSVLDSIAQAEALAAVRKKEALSEAREIVRQAEAEAAKRLSDAIEDARAAAAAAIADAEQMAEQQAGALLERSGSDRESLESRASSKIQPAIDEIVAAVLR